MLSLYYSALMIAALPQVCLGYSHNRFYINTVMQISGSAIARSESSSTDRYVPGSFKDVLQDLKIDATGVLSVGEDGVLRSYTGDLEVVDYRQLDPEQVATFGRQQLDAWTLGGGDIPDSVLALVQKSIDGRLVTEEDDLIHPTEKPRLGDKPSSRESRNPKPFDDLIARQSAACAGSYCEDLPTCTARGCNACYFPNGPPDGRCLDPNPNLPPF
jgi:hypothetical protein